MRVELHPCYVLHRRPYRETSLLLEVLSAEHGRQGLVARGAVGRSREGWAVLLQPFRGLRLAWSQRGELGTLTAVDAEPRPAVPAPARLPSAFYLNELLLRLLARADPQPEIFLAYDTALRALAGEGPEQQTLRVFEKRLLEALGYGLVLERAADTGAPLVAERCYHYVPEHGPCERPPAGASSQPVQGATLRELAEERLSAPGSVREAKLLLRFLLGRHLGERPLASRRLHEPL